MDRNIVSELRAVVEESHDENVRQVAAGAADAIEELQQRVGRLEEHVLPRDPDPEVAP